MLEELPPGQTEISLRTRLEGGDSLLEFLKGNPRKDESWKPRQTSSSLKIQGLELLKKEMATHSSVLAWRIPGTGEPGGLPSMGSQSRHNFTRLKRLSSSSRATESSTAIQINIIWG